METRCGRESQHPAEGASGPRSRVWRPDQLETRCGRESQHPAEGASGQQIESLEIRTFGEKMLDYGTCPREAGPPGPRLSSPGERERNVDGLKSGGQYVAVLFGLQLPLTHNPFNKVRGIFF